jgi:hypothetical protein
MRSAFLIVLLLASTSVYAVTIDFSDPALPTSGLEEGFETNGFSFTFGPEPIPNPPAFAIGSLGMVGFHALAFCPGCDMALERTNGSEFSLHSFEALIFSIPSVPTLEVTGYTSGESVVQSFILTDASQSFEVNWNSLTRVEFNYFGSEPTIMPTITVSSVPIPAAVWLFGSGLGLLGWFRCRRTA